MLKLTNMVRILFVSSVWSRQTLAYLSKSRTIAFAANTSVSGSGKAHNKISSSGNLFHQHHVHHVHHDYQHQRSHTTHSTLSLFKPTTKTNNVQLTILRSTSTHNNDNDASSELKMENIYTEWTIEDDKILFKNIDQPIHKVASILGRGLNGVVARKKKLKNIQSAAYQRLFIGNNNDTEKNHENESSNDNSKKLVPVKEVLRRIKWDVSLDAKDFTVSYYDRVDEKIYDSPFDAKNESVQGKEEMFVFAIPEHRIMSFKYKDRLVWDKDSRLDCVFGSMNGNGETIYDVMANYEQWIKEEEEKREFQKRRQKELASQIQLMLGDNLFSSLKVMSKDIQDRAMVKEISDQDVITYVNAASSLFRKANLPSQSGSESRSVDDIEALNLFSDLVALLPNEDLREKILLCIYQLVLKLEKAKNPKKHQNQPLESLIEDELTETFVRGSGAGGQKVNKTANRVVLVHTPTQLRVECQDTRSLQQNRKIARKRLALKLDQHLNGVSSRTEMKAAKKINKKAKAKARNKARQRKKKEKKLKNNE